MIITTTDLVHGKKVERFLGIVAGEAVIGSNVIADLFRGLRGVVSSTSSEYRKHLIAARTLALKDMENNAIELGANAVIGVDLDYEVLDRGEVVLMVVANGTAIVLADEMREAK